MSESRVIRLMEKPFRVEITKTSKGAYSWSIKVAGDTPSECLQELERLIARVEQRCQEGWKPVTPKPAKKPPEPPRKEAELSLAETVESLPWKPYQSGNGGWIFTDLAEDNPVARELKEAIERSPKGQLELGPYVYRISGEGRFIGRILKPKAKTATNGGIYTNSYKTGVPKTGENFTPPKIQWEQSSKTAAAFSFPSCGGEV